MAIGYQQLGDGLIQDIPIAAVQDSGLIFMWVINAKYRFAISMLEKWGYAYVTSPLPFSFYVPRFA